MSPAKNCTTLAGDVVGNVDGEVDSIIKLVAGWRFNEHRGDQSVVDPVRINPLDVPIRTCGQSVGVRSIVGDVRARVSAAATCEEQRHPSSSSYQTHPVLPRVA